MSQTPKLQKFKMSGLSIFLAVLACLSVAFAFTGAGVSAGPIPEDCPEPQRQWYDCYQKRSYMVSQAGIWCSKADRTKPQATDSNPDPDSKRDECISWLLTTQINYRPSAFKASALATCARAVPNPIEKDDCYVVLNDGTWYRLLKSFGDDCSFVDTDQECAQEKYIEFARSKSWYVEPRNSAGGGTLAGGGRNTPAQDTPFVKRVAIYIDWITIGIGVLAVFGFILAGIQYSAAGDNSSAVAEAKKRMSNIVIAIVLYVFMFALLQWLVPGGLF